MTTIQQQLNDARESGTVQEFVQNNVARLGELTGILTAEEYAFGSMTLDNMTPEQLERLRGLVDTNLAELEAAGDLTPEQLERLEAAKQ